MGEKYNRWNTDPVVRPLLAAYHMEDAPTQLGNALEVLMFRTKTVRQQYSMTIIEARGLIFERTNLKFEPLRRFLDDLKHVTVDRQ
jgi:hypothetical protein